MLNSLFSPPESRLNTPFIPYSTAVIGQKEDGSWNSLPPQSLKSVVFRHPVFRHVRNDHTDQSLLLLLEAKCIIHQNLCRMPQDYITRFIFHPRHATCLVFKDGKGIGAICYRPFFQFHFTEIVFAAVLPEFRGSGYGRLLMNYVKDHLQAQDIRYLIVYADDSAIGYFHRVGFSTQFPSDAPQDYFKPYVSQYDSATLMISPIDPDLDYKNSNFWTAAVREYLSSQYKVGEEKQIRRWPVTSIAGIPVPRVPPEPPIEDIMTVILDRIWSHPSATPFRQPVSCADSPFYRNFTENPMDLSTIRSKVKQQKYKKFNNFMNDLRLIFTNCYQYNGDSSPYTKTAQDLERFVRDITEPILKSKGIKERWEWMTE